MAHNTEGAMKKIARAGTMADILELRLDVMASFSLKRILKSTSKPCIVTYRSKKEGGKGSVNYTTVMRHMMHAAACSARYIDVEYSMPLAYRHEIFKQRGTSAIIMSKHILNGTPSRESLDHLYGKMSATGADIVKIVARANAWEDNLRILELIPKAKGQGIRMAAFCTGPIGRISRLFSYLMGAHLTFASLEEGEESAEGQIPFLEMKKILALFNHEH